MVFEEKHLDEWLKLADSKDKGERMAAAQALGSIASKAPAAVPTVVVPLGKMLKDDSAHVRRNASESLSLVGPNVKDAVPALGDALKDGDAIVRKNAMKALLNAGPEAVAALPALIKVLDEGDRDLRPNALKVIGQCNAEPTDVLPAIKKGLGDRSLAKDAVNMAVKIGEPAVPMLIEVLEGTDVNANNHAAKALIRLGPKAKSAVPALSKALYDKDGTLRGNAADALAAIGPDAAAATDALLDRLGDDDACSSAAKALITIGPKQEWIPRLIAVLKDGSRNEKAAAATLLGVLGKPAIDPLLDVMRINNADTLEQAAYALGKIGPEARPALDKLFVLLQDNDANVCQYAGIAMDRIGLDENLIPRLVEVVKSEKGYGRSDACTLLCKEKLRKKGVPQLALLLTMSGDDGLKPAAILDILAALQKLPPADGKPAIDAIVKLLQNEDEETKRSAARVLKKIDPATAAKNGVK
jgi:HEAT repeat protein